MKQKLIFLTALFAALSAFSAEYFVDAARPDDTGAATNWATAKQTIQAAVDLAVDGDTVWVAKGVYNIGERMDPYSQTNRVCITNAITVRSVNGFEETIITGGNAIRGVFIQNGGSLVGFSVTNCNVNRMLVIGLSLSRQGGGVYVDSGSLSNCTMTGNSAESGGGIYINAGNLVNCTLSENVALDGGGVYLNSGSLSNCTVTENRAFTGGGVYVNSGSLSSCTLTGNYASVGGGGACVNNGNLVSCTLIGNSVDSVGIGDGGGVCGGALYGCLVAGNTGFSGGAVSDSELFGCSVVGNTSGGVANSSLENCIVWDNDGGDLDGCSASFTCASNGVTNGVMGCIVGDPLFVDAANGDFRLQSNSPCINWGSNLVVSNVTDLAGNPRIVEGVVDMGAYEYQSSLNLSDSDGDELPDDWERQYFGGNQNPDATCSNGVNTILQAYIIGLNPNDPDSRLLATMLPGQSLAWEPGVSGRVYSVYWTTNLLNEFQCLETNIPWTAGSFADTNHIGNGQIFYKIGVELAP